MKYTKIYLFLITIFLSVGCGFTFIPESDYDVDTTSPYVNGVRWDGVHFFDITRKTNSSFDEILNTTSEDRKNYNVSPQAEIMVTFSEDMYIDSLFQYGVSETVVVIEGEPSRSFLNGMKSPPLSDYNIAKILKVKVKMLSEDSKNQLILDFSDAEDCVTEDDFKTKFCKLKKDTNYTLVVSKGVLNENGRELVVETDDTKFIEDNFVMLFRTTGTPPTVTSTQPADNETDICLNLQEVKVNFSADMDQSSITPDSFTLSNNNVNVSEVTLQKEARYATLTLNKDLTPGTYKINLESSIRSKSRVNIEPISFTFTTAASASSVGPEFVQNPTAVVTGNSVEVSWTTDVKSLADIKYGKGTTTNTDYAYNAYDTVHSVTIDLVDGPGDYTISIQPKDRCGNISVAKTTSATILNHPLISEVSPNPDSSSNEFIELYNAGDTVIDLGQYTLVLGADEFPLENQDLPAGGYFVLVDSGHNLTVLADVVTLQDIDLTKSEDVFLKLNGINVDTYTYDFKASGSSNFSAQRVDVNLRDSDGTNYCESTPTPGAVNSCE